MKSLYALIVLFMILVSPVRSQVRPIEACPIDLIMVLDGSGSIAPEDFEIMRRFANQVTESVLVGTTEARVGLVEFSTDSQLLSPLLDEARSVSGAVYNMEQTGGDTNIVAGMQTAEQEFLKKQSEYPRVMLVLTDGEHTESGDPIATAARIRGEGVQIFGLAVGEARLDQISGIAGGDENVFLVENFAGLLPLLTNLLDRSCHIDVGFRESHLAFTSDRDGDLEVYLLDPDTGEITQLTFNDATDNVPTFSPDGLQIAFESDVDGDYEIWVMNLDGSNLHQLTNNDIPDFGPSWSPDGTMIAYHATGGAGTNIMVVDADGSNLRMVTNTSGINRSPSWSPDGQRVVYQSDRTGGREVFITNVYTGSTIQLTSNDWYDGLPDWSPTGSQIVFGSARADGDVEIWVMRADGSNPVRLTNRAGTDDDPAWSPDGTRIIFESDSTGNNEVWIINANGTGLTNITNDPALDYSSDWGWKP